MGAVLRIAILANARQAIREFKDTEVAAGKMGTGVGGAGKKMAGLAIGAVGIGTVTEALSTGIKEASAYQDVARQTAQALATNGHLAGLTADEVQKNSAALESLTGAKIDENDATDAQNRLIRAGVQDRKILNQGLKQAANVALATGKDIGSVSQALSKALANPAKAAGVLGKAGIVLSKAQQDQIASMVKAGKAADAQAFILESLGQKYNGAAEAAGKGFSADVGRAQDALADSERDIATAVLPTLAKLAQSFAKGLPKAIDAVGPPLKVVFNLLTNPIFLTVAGVIGGIVLAWKAYQGVMVVVRAATAAYTAVQAALNVVLSLNPIGLIVIAIAALVIGLVIAYQKSETFRRVVNGALSAVADAFGFLFRAAGVALSWLKDNWQLVTLAIVAPVALIPLYIAKHLNQIVGFFTGLGGRIKAGTVGMFDGIKDAFRSAINYVIRKWNDLELGIPAVDTKVPGIGKVGGFALKTPNIPLLASGGIVRRPTLAVLGEAGDEAIIPLNRLGSGGTTNVYHITVEVSPTADQAEIGRQTVKAIEAHERTSGRQRLIGSGGVSV